MKQLLFSFLLCCQLMFTHAQTANTALKESVKSARLLANGAALKTTGGNDGLVINLPGNAPDPIATVIKIEL